MNDLARAVAQRNDRLHAQTAPLAYPLGHKSLGYDDPGAAVESVDEGAMAVTFVVSTDALDHQGDRLRPELIDPEPRWRANPVWLWDHQGHEPPVGTGERPDGSLAWWVRDGKAFSTCHFHQHTQRAVEAFRLYASKVMRACSIRFDAIEGRKVRTGLDGVDEPKVGWEFGRVVLLEISVTPMGVNHEALAVELGRGGYSDSVTKSLSVYLPPRRLYVAGWKPRTKGDDKVSRKIAKLVNEGKKQDQAVAIALDMERRGELETKAMAGQSYPREDEESPYRTAAMDAPDDTPDGYEDEPEPQDYGTANADMGQEEPDADEAGGASDMDSDDMGGDMGPPGSQALQAISSGAQAMVSQINDLLPQNENPKVVKALQRALADLQDVADAMDTLHGQEYGGGDEDNPPPDMDGGAPEEKGMDAEDGDEKGDMEEDDEEKREKALAEWRGRLSRLKGWLDKKGLPDPSLTKRVTALEKELATAKSELAAVNNEWARIKGLVYRHTGLPAAKPQTRAVAGR